MPIQAVLLPLGKPTNNTTRKTSRVIGIRSLKISIAERAPIGFTMKKERRGQAIRSRLSIGNVPFVRKSMRRTGIKKRKSRLTFGRC